MIAALVRHRRAALALLVIAVAALSAGLPHALVPDNSLSVWFLETDPQLGAYHAFQQHFGNDEVILLQVVEREGIVTAPAIERLRRLVGELRHIDGIEQVVSVVDAQDAFAGDEANVHFASAIPPTLPDDPQALRALQQRVLASPMLAERVVSADGKTAMLWIQMAVMDDIDARRDAIVAAVRAAADRTLGEATPHAMAGTGVIYSGLNELTRHDFGIFVNVSYLLIFGLLWWLFRSWWIVGATMGVIIAATLAALGSYGLAGHQLNMVTVVLPVVIVVLAIADAVHMPATFVQIRQRRPHADRTEIVIESLKESFWPCLMTSATTMAGFFALATSPMAVVRELGIYAGVGVGVAWLATMIIMPSVLHALPKGSNDARLRRHRWVEGLLKRSSALLLHHRRAAWAATLLIIVVAAWGARAVRVDTYTLGYLPETHPVIVDHKAIEASWGPYGAVEFLIEARPGLRVDSPEIINGMGRFVRTASALPQVKRGYSLEGLYRHLAAVFGSDLGTSAGTSTELSGALVAQIGLLLEMQDFTWERGSHAFHDNPIAAFMTQDASLGRVTLVGAMMSAGELGSLLQRVTELGQQAFGGAATVRAAGYPPLYVQIVDYVMASQLSGFPLALLLIFLMMAAWLRSVKLAVVGLIPNLFPVLVIVGVMGWFGIDLDIGTATVATIVLGVSIDDTIHFLHAWRHAQDRGADWSFALGYTFNKSGSAAVITTLLLVLGYPVLMLADVATVVYFGLLTTISAAAALYGDLVMLPLLLRLFPPRSRIAARSRTDARAA